jgi:hypothetical protein
VAGYSVAIIMCLLWKGFMHFVRSGIKEARRHVRENKPAEGFPNQTHTKERALRR